MLIAVGERHTCTGRGGKLVSFDVREGFDAVLPEGQQVVFDHGFHERVHGALLVVIEAAIEIHMR